MLTSKRVIATTTVGCLCGLICMAMACSNPDTEEPVSTMLKWSIVIGRTMMGFTIGISALRLKWWLHGIVLGIVCSIPMAIPVAEDLAIAVGTIVMGIIYGFLIELITSKFLKSPPVGLSIQND